jgi:hypothetical protein
VEDSLSWVSAGDVVSGYRHRPSVIGLRGLGYSGKGRFGRKGCLAARFVTSEKSSAIAVFFDCAKGLFPLLHHGAPVHALF